MDHEFWFRKHASMASFIGVAYAAACIAIGLATNNRAPVVAALLLLVCCYLMAVFAAVHHAFGG